ncbi:hypothetical protein [Lacrimispora amygdalina]|uniref:hypothetical protein n=1 Tax=Lacrimispora amygdalina TaxID=253257 RepID=UPI000BE28C93|nr:hypothetical protein [Lacrimispora amygdalina]
MDNMELFEMVQTTVAEVLDVEKEEMVSVLVVSRQIIIPESSDRVRMTITEVHLEAGACRPRHVIQDKLTTFYGFLAFEESGE